MVNTRAIGAGAAWFSLREVASGKVVHSWQAFDRQGLWVWTLEYLPDGKSLLSGGGLAGRLWSTPDGGSIGTAMEHNSEVRTALLGPMGRSC